MSKCLFIALGSGLGPPPLEPPLSNPGVLWDAHALASLEVTCCIRGISLVVEFPSDCNELGPSCTCSLLISLMRNKNFLMKPLRCVYDNKWD